MLKSQNVKIFIFHRKLCLRLKSTELMPSGHKFNAVETDGDRRLWTGNVNQLDAVASVRCRSIHYLL